MHNISVYVPLLVLRRLHYLFTCMAPNRCEHKVELLNSTFLSSSCPFQSSLFIYCFIVVLLLYTKTNKTLAQINWVNGIRISSSSLSLSSSSTVTLEYYYYLLFSN